MSIAPTPITYGMRIRLRHFSSGRLLKSWPKNYFHTASSGEQIVVTTTDEDETSSIWLVKSKDGTLKDYRAGEVVGSSDVVRLEHLDTQKNLQALDAFRPPVARDNSQREVSAHGTQGIGSRNDDWQVDASPNAQWLTGSSVRLIHCVTSRALHSHSNHHHIYTDGCNEVTAYSARDEQDLWNAEPISSVSQRISTIRPHAETVTDVIDLLASFADCVGYALNRRGSPVLDLKDEDRVQDLVYFMLRPSVADLVPEQPVPNPTRQYAIQDFRSANLGVVVEVKRIHSKAHGKSVLTEINDDIGRYKHDPACRDLVVFIYDPEHFIESPTGLKNQVEGPHTHNDKKFVLHCIIER